MAAATYWVGQDGNIYYGSGQEGTPVQNLGSAAKGQFEGRADGLYDRFTDNGTPSLTYAAQQIADPSGGGTVAGVNTTAPSGGGTPARVAPTLNQGAVDATQTSIDEMPGILERALASDDQTYANTVNSFNEKETAERGTYNKSTDTNIANYDDNFMSSIRSGIKGLGGLMQLLRGTGAAGGTAEDMARETVGDITSGDIRAGADTQKENQASLDGSYGSFMSDLKRKRQANDDAKVNNERAIRRDSQTQLQDLFGKMAGYYGDAEQVDNANSWMARGAALTPSIAANSNTQVSNYDQTPVTVKAAPVTAFDAPSQANSQARSMEPGQVGSGIFAINDPRKKERENSRFSVPVGA